MFSGEEVLLVPSLGFLGNLSEAGMRGPTLPILELGSSSGMDCLGSGLVFPFFYFFFVRFIHFLREMLILFFQEYGTRRNPPTMKHAPILAWVYFFISFFFLIIRLYFFPLCPPVYHTRCKDVRGPNTDIKSVIWRFTSEWLSEEGLRLGPGRWGILCEY